MRATWPMVVFVAFTASLVSAQAVGRITGSVLSEDGQLVGHAEVCISAFVAKNSTSIRCIASTDKDGEFQIENVKFGTYGLLAVNEGEGYSITNQSPARDVVVTAANPSPNVIIRLRPRGGILLGTVRDKFTGEPVKGIMVQYLAIDGDASGSSPAFSDGEFRVAVPTQCDLVILVYAPGYHGWVYTDMSSPSRPLLRLASGERKTVDIEMEPKKQR
jgi:hypothetical protein